MSFFGFYNAMFDIPLANILYFVEVKIHKK